MDIHCCVTLLPEKSVSSGLNLPLSNAAETQIFDPNLPKILDFNEFAVSSTNFAIFRKMR